MKLSTWTIYHWLEYKGLRPTSAITDGKLVVEGLRFQTFGKSNSDPGSFAQITSRHIVPGGGFLQTAPVCGKDMILLPNASAEQLCNEVLWAFTFHDRRECDLVMALLERQPIQKLLDIVHQVFQRPMFIKSDSSWVFATIGGYDISVHPGWARLENSVANKRSNFNAVEAVGLDPEFRAIFLQHYPSILKSPFYQGNVPHANVRLEDRRVCETMVVEND